MKQKELNKILLDHKKWLEGGGGKQANLQGDNLQRADLQGADLRWANLGWVNLLDVDLEKANLQGVNLQGADLRWVNLQGTDLQGADLRVANLRWVDLQDADLRVADLQGASLQDVNLKGADLQGANLQGCPELQLQCPESGGFTAYKKLRDELICELYILPEARRSSATTRKCRCDKAKVVLITDKNGTPYTEGVSQYDSNFIYKVGEIVEVQSFNENRWAECSTGIHFFITKQEAIDY